MTYCGHFWVVLLTYYVYSLLYRTVTQSAVAFVYMGILARFPLVIFKLDSDSFTVHMPSLLISRLCVEILMSSVPLSLTDQILVSYCDTLRYKNDIGKII